MFAIFLNGTSFGNPITAPSPLGIKALFHVFEIAERDPVGIASPKVLINAKKALTGTIFFL